MKKLLATLSFVVICIVIHAQDTTLKDYVGKYTYPSGSIITSSELVLEGNVLKAISERGAVTLEKRSKDTFAIVEHNGMAYFSRNAVGKVARVRVVIEDLILEGTKDGVTALLRRKVFSDIRRETAK